MTLLVVDASVALKWFLRSPDEADTAAAVRLLQSVNADTFGLLQPPHFLGEVCAVLARQEERFAMQAAAALMDIEMQVVADPATYRLAMSLSRRLQHHLFDTLYHALALQMPGALLVTADERYYRVAQGEGRIKTLRAFDVDERP